MAVQERDPHWWLDVLPSGIRRLWKRYGRPSILPRQCARVGSGRIVNARKAMKAFLVKVRGLLCRSSPAAAAVSCADPLEAYMHACIVAPFFCYVPPSIYGLTASDDERGIAQVDPHPEDDVRALDRLSPPET